MGQSGSPSMFSDGVHGAIGMRNCQGHTAAALDLLLSFDGLGFAVRKRQKSMSEQRRGFRE